MICKTLKKDFCKIQYKIDCPIRVSQWFSCKKSIINFISQEKQKEIMVFGAYVVQCGSGINHDKVFTRLYIKLIIAKKKLTVTALQKS